jgi:hypothetical protein
MKTKNCYRKNIKSIKIECKGHDFFSEKSYFLYKFQLPYSRLVYWARTSQATFSNQCQLGFVKKKGSVLNYLSVKLHQKRENSAYWGNPPVILPPDTATAPLPTGEALPATY